MNAVRVIPMMILGAGAAAALLLLCMVMTRSGPPKLSQTELTRLTKIFLAVRSSPDPAAPKRRGKLLGLESTEFGNPYSGSSNETLYLIALPLPAELLATSPSEASTIVFLDRLPGVGSDWHYQVYLATPDGQSLGQFTCGRKEVGEKLKALPESPKS